MKSIQGCGLGHSLFCSSRKTVESADVPYTDDTDDTDKTDGYRFKDTKAEFMTFMNFHHAHGIHGALGVHGKQIAEPVTHPWNR